MIVKILEFLRIHIFVKRGEYRIGDEIRLEKKLKDANIASRYLGRKGIVKKIGFLDNMGKCKYYKIKIHDRKKLLTVFAWEIEGKR